MTTIRRFAAYCALSLPTLLALLTPASPACSTPASIPPIRHVFVVILENQAYHVTFGPHSAAPYLATTLPRRGALLSNYYGIGHASLDNYIALISGQAPNEETQADCAIFTEFQLRESALDAHGQALGKGCVYPAMVRTLPDQLEAAGLTWKGYMEDMGRDPHRESATCGHGTIGQPDHGLHAVRGDQYATKHNPFIYFHSIIDDVPRCDSHVVNLQRLTEDLRSSRTTPNYVFITPNLCNDGHDAPCVDGAPGGLISANGFLKKWVPEILSSPAFRKGGLLIVTFDESDGGGADGLAACCGEQGLPGARNPPGWTGPGGGRIGAVLLSPFIRPGTVSRIPYNHYSLLRTVEDIFSLPHLGYAADSQLRSFGTDVFRKRPAVSSPHVDAPRKRSTRAPIQLAPASAAAGFSEFPGR